MTKLKKLLQNKNIEGGRGVGCCGRDSAIKQLLKTLLLGKSDQIGAPTGADLLADVTAHAISATLQRPAHAGLYHLVASGQTSWFGYAKHVLAQSNRARAAPNLIATEVAAVPTGAFPSPARWPNNSRLNTTKLHDTFGLHLPDWQHGVNRMPAEILWFLRQENT